MIFACERPLRLVDVPDLPCRACVPAGASGGSSSRPKWCGTLKELKDGVALDRLSCSRFHANQFRLLLTTAAYILFQSLRLASRGTAWGTAQVTTLRERRLKIGVWLEAAGWDWRSSG